MTELSPEREAEIRAVLARCARHFPSKDRELTALCDLLAALDTERENTRRWQEHSINLAEENRRLRALNDGLMDFPADADCILAGK